MTGRCLTFYVFIVSTILFAIKAGTNQGIQPIPDWMSFANLILLAIVPTVISNITLVLAVRGIGGTLSPPYVSGYWFSANLSPLTWR